MRKFLLAATAVLALAGSAHAQTAEVRGCTLVGPVTMYTRPDGRVWAEFSTADIQLNPNDLSQSATTKVNIWDHYDDPKTKIRWVYITSENSQLANFWVKRKNVICPNLN
jgi:hypothetical protein